MSISERPASVEDRAVPGHWEGDLLCGSANSYMVTLVERQTRYVMLAKIPSRHTQTVVKALIKQARQLPEELYKSPRHGSVGSQSGPIEPSGKRTQRTASQDARLRFASRTISSLCCVHRLKRQSGPVLSGESSIIDRQPAACGHERSLGLFR